MPRRSVREKRKRLMAQATAQRDQAMEAGEPAACRWPGCTKMLDHPSVLCVYHTMRFEKNGGVLPNA